jgi:hypothetical protein
VHRAASVGEHRKHVDQLLGHSVQGADDGTVDASRGGGLVNWALMASWIA